MENYSVVDVTEGIDAHREAILQLWGNNTDAVAPERFDWLYKRNPCGPARTWLALARNSAVGIGSLYPRKVFINGTERMAGVAVDFAVDKKHRVLGPALKIQKAIIAGSHAGGFQFNLAYPNASSKAIFPRVGYRVVGEVKNYIKLLKTGKRMTLFIKNGTLAKIPSLLIDKFFWMLDLRLRILTKYDLHGEILDRADERFDVLWQEARPRQAIIGEKTAIFLNWRYAASVLPRFRFFCLFGKDRQHLKGFIVYSVKDDVVTIADLFSAGEELSAVLIARFVEYLRKGNISFISFSYFGREEFSVRARKFNFIERKSKRSFFVFYGKSCDAETIKTILDPENWSLLGGDLDL